MKGVEYGSIHDFSYSKFLVHLGNHVHLGMGAREA